MVVFFLPGGGIWVSPVLFLSNGISDAALQNNRNPGRIVRADHIRESRLSTSAVPSGARDGDDRASRYSLGKKKPVEQVRLFP